MSTPFFHSKIVSSHDQLSFPQQLGEISSFSLGTSSTTASTSPFLFDSSQHHHKPLHDEEMKLGSTWCNDYGRGVHQSASSDHHPRDQPVKWMSSKMRIMRKMINSYQTPTTTKPRRCNNHHLQDHQKIKANLDNGIIRVCSDCNTTKTPLWRSGPCGPKSLCNACGIRQRKARRAMAATAVKDNGPSEVDRTVPFKKRCRFAAAAAAAACVDNSSTTTARDQRKLCFEDIVIRLSKSSAFHRVFPQDEKDAAILLMALSSGLLCSS